MRAMAVLMLVLVLCLAMTAAFTVIVPQFSQTSEISWLEVNSQLVLRLICNDALQALDPGSGGGGGGTI